jgi:hypothetical protein
MENINSKLAKYEFKLAYYNNLKKQLLSQNGGTNCTNGCGRKPYGNFSTCCQACANGSHTTECDKRIIM